MDFYETSALDIVLSIVGTIVICCIFPLIYTRVQMTCQTFISARKAKVLIIINGVVAGLIFILLTGANFSAGPIFLWSFIMYRYMKKRIVSDDQEKN